MRDPPRTRELCMHALRQHHEREGEARAQPSRVGPTSMDSVGEDIAPPCDPGVVRGALYSHDQGGDEHDTHPRRRKAVALSKGGRVEVDLSFHVETSAQACK